jgi:hypothetical protein
MGDAWQVLGPNRASIAEQRGTAMTVATAAEYALMLTAPLSPKAPPPAQAKLSARDRSWSGWSLRAAPTPRSPPSCTSPSALSAPTWTGSGTRPAAAAALT